MWFLVNKIVVSGKQFCGFYLDKILFFILFYLKSAPEYNLSICITISILVCYVNRLKELSRLFDFFFSSN